MRLTRAQSLLAAGLVAATSVATAVVLIAVPASAKPAAPSNPHPVVLVNPCKPSKGQVEPSTYDIGCMASQQLVSGLSWTSWKSAAFGSGTLKVNSCTPTCASGKYIKYPILVVLWRAKPWPHHQGRQYFSRLTWIFTGKRPSVVHTAAQTLNLPS
jgi:hypothetical protein